MGADSKIAQSKYDDNFFDISPEFGFLPKYTPTSNVPDAFLPVARLCQDMPIWKNYEYDVPGLLDTKGALEKRVLQLPDLTYMCKNLEMHDLQTLFRIYTFLASGYLLEPTYHHYLKTGEYGEAKQYLPKQIARPLCAIAEKIRVFPWLDYHYAYCMGNVILKDPDGPKDWTNMGLLNSFAGTPDEEGFITVHVDINQCSPKIIEAILMCIDGMQDKDLAKIESAFRLNTETMIEANQRRQRIYRASDPTKYNQLRIFILGITGNKKVFGDGVVYEGVEKFNGEPVSFRGQTGAQDNIIPTQDIFTGVIERYPDNLLTQYLLDLREYRPTVVQRFLADLQSDFLGFYDFLLSTCQSAKQHDPLLELAKSVEQIYKFRNGHWMMVQQFILKQTTYDTATGGTPITTWLPNQIDATLHHLEKICSAIDSDMLIEEQSKIEYDRLLGASIDYRDLLERQISLLSKEKYDPNTIYETNGVMKEDV